MITAYFGGLRHTETDGLKIENFVTTKEGVIVTHARSKVNFLYYLWLHSFFLQQRSDMKESIFLIPSQETGINYSKIVTEYLNLIKLDLGKTTGRMWFTGRNQAFVSSPMGKNSISKVIFLLSPEGAFLYFTWFVFFTVRGTDTACKSVSLHMKLAHWVTIARGDRYCL